MHRSRSETWMFSVVIWIPCSWLPCPADWQVSCFRYVVQLQQNIGHQNDCEHEWQSTFFPKKTWGSEQNFLRRDEYRQPDSQVLCLTMTSLLDIPSWQYWTQLVVWPATKEVDAMSAWCVRDVWLLWWWSAWPQQVLAKIKAYRTWRCVPLEALEINSDRDPTLKQPRYRLTSDIYRLYTPASASRRSHGMMATIDQRHCLQTGFGQRQRATTCTSLAACAWVEWNRRRDREQSRAEDTLEWFRSQRLSTIRYDSVYLTCSIKLTGSQLSPPHVGTNRQIKEKKRTKSKSRSVINPVRSQT